MRRRLLLSGGKKEPNTIIGGIGGTINTKALLATKLGISESIIRNFEVVGSDVHCRITANYEIPSICFQADVNINFFIDLDGKVTKINARAFYQSWILNAFFPNALLANDAFRQSKLNQSAYGYQYSYNLPTVDVSTYALAYTKFVKLNILLATDFSAIGHFAAYNTQLQEVTGSIQHIGIRMFYSNTSLNSINQLSIITIADFGLYQTAFTSLNMINLTTMGEGSVRALSSCVTADFPSLTTISNNNLAFQNWTSATRISFKKLTTFGNAANHNNAFQNLKTGCLIETNIAMATANAGSPHAALVWVKANRGATVEFYDNAGNYVSTL